MMARWCGGLTAACVLSATAFLAGCSSSTTSSVTNNSATSTSVAKSSASASASSSHGAMCKSADTLKDSIAGLKNMNVRSGGISAVQNQFTAIQQAFDQFKAVTKGQFAPQVDALSSAMSKLHTSLDAAKASLNAGTLSGLASAAGSVVAAGSNLVTAATDAC